MQLFLRILQITLIITQIKAASSVTAAQTSITSSLLSNETLKTSKVSSSATQPKSSMTSVPVTVSTEQSTKANNVPDTSTVTTGVAATSSEPMAQESGTSAKLSPSSSQKSNSSEPLKTSSVSGNATQPESPMTSVLVAAYSLSSASRPGSIALTTAASTATQPESPMTSVLLAASTELSTKAGNVSDASTKATNFSHSGRFTSQTQSVTANYSLSSASRPGSIALTTAEPTATRSSFIVQTLTPSRPVSVNWTDWSVDSDDCQEYCSGKGGTVTASRQCYSHSSTLDNKVCTKHDNLTRVVKCDEPYCPISGKQAFRSSISTLAVSFLLIMLSSTFWRG